MSAHLCISKPAETMDVSVQAGSSRRTRKLATFGTSARRDALLACARTKRKTDDSAQHQIVNTTATATVAENRVPPRDRADNVLGVQDARKLLRSRQRAKVAEWLASTPPRPGPSSPTNIYLSSLRKLKNKSSPTPVIFPIERSYSDPESLPDSGYCSSEFSRELRLSHRSNGSREDVPSFPNVESFSQKAPQTSTRPSRSKPSLWRQTISRSSSMSIKTAGRAPTPATSQVTLDVVMAAVRLLPLPRYDPFRRTRADTLSSIAKTWTCTLVNGCPVEEPFVRRRCKSAPHPTRPAVANLRNLER